MQLYYVRNWTNSLDDVVSWRSAGVPERIGGGVFLGFYQVRAWLMQRLGDHRDGTADFKVVDWDDWNDFDITRASPIYPNGPFDVLSGMNVFGPGRWTLIAKWLCFMEHTGPDVYRTRSAI